MKIKSNIIFLLLLTSLNFIKTQDSQDDAPVKGKDFPDITCGKKNPKEPKDCTKYGTDSGMLCCWISKDKDSTDGKCYLLSEKMADQKGIDGSKIFQNQNSDGYKFWNCGNKSTYLDINIFVILIASFFIYNF